MAGWLEAGPATYDVLVAGAGPAGSRTARDIARAGYTVALLEEHGEVGIPSHCSGLVTPRVLELADAGDGLVRNAIRGAHFRLPSGRSLSVGGDRVHALAIDRAELDRRLSRQAADAGATLLTGTRLLDYRLEGDAARGTSGRVVAEVAHGGVGAQLSARLLIGADGARSLVAAKLNGRSPGGHVMGYGVVASGLAAHSLDHVGVFLDPASAPGWFGWSIPLGDGTVRLGTGSNNAKSVRESMADLARRFPNPFANVVVHVHSAGVIALWRPTRIAGDRVMLVGDAARQVKPTSGGGVYAALHAGELAAREAVGALSQLDLSERRLAAYERAWRDSLGREMRRGYDLRRIFERLTESRLERLFDALEHPNLMRSIERVGDIDYPSRVAWAIARHDPVLAVSLAALPRFPGAWVG